MKPQPILSTQLAQTDTEYEQLLKSDADWICRNAADLQQLRDEGVQPFARLSDDAFRAFAESATFKNGGLAHVDYAPLRGELAFPEIAQAFTYFGISPTLLTDYQDKKCDGNHTCIVEYNKVCTSNC